MPDPTLESVLRSALAHLEVACQVIDANMDNRRKLPALSTHELQLMADVVAKTNELVAGYEDQLPQGV